MFQEKEKEEEKRESISFYQVVKKSFKIFPDHEHDIVNEINVLYNVHVMLRWVSRSLASSVQFEIIYILHSLAFRFDARRLISYLISYIFS